jgi:nucleoid-associated protein YgaU
MRVVRPLWWLAVAGAALAGFVAVGEMVELPLRWGDLGGWLEEASIEDALVEITRWVGMVLSGYVVVVAALVLLVDLADAVRAVPLARLLRRVAGGVAVPALRRRLVEASTATAITVSAMTATAGGSVVAGAPSVDQVVDVDVRPGAPVDLPAGISPGQVIGFGIDPQTRSADQTRPTVDGDRRVVAEGDTVWDLAVAHYGFCNAAVVDAIAAASGLDDPNLIYPGQVLVFPILDRAVVAAPPDVPAGAATWSVHTVVAGDTLWDILEARYGEVTADLVWSVADYNGIKDPSDLAIGTRITLPPPTLSRGEEEAPPRRPPAPPPAAEETARTAKHPAAGSPPSPPVSEGATPPPVIKAPAQPPVLAEVSDPADAPVEVPPVKTPPDSAPSSPATTTSSTKGADAVELAPWLVGLAGATTLAAGLLAVYRRLRHRQAAAGARAWRLMPSGPSAELYRQLVAAADLPLVRWAGQELSGVLFGLGHPAAGPLAVEVSEATGLELLWDAPMPDAPAPWEATDDGWLWRLLYDPAAEVPEHVLPPAVPGLVTVGRRGDAQLLVDLEAYGSLAVAGDARAAEDVVRSMVLEYGAGDELSDAWVSTVGLGVDGVEHLGRVQARGEQEALTHARGVVADQRKVMEAAGVDGTFVLRVSAPPTAREVTVIAVRAESCSRLEELLMLAQPRCGLVVVVLGDVSGTGARLIVDDQGDARLEPLGVTVQAANVSHEAAANTAVLLDAAAEPVTVEDLGETERSPNSEQAPPPASTPDATAGIAVEVAALDGPDGVDLGAAGELLADDDDGRDGWQRPAPRLLVRVLGPPRVESPAKLTPQQRTVVVFVASMGGVTTVERLREALWGGKLRSDERFWHVLSAVRSVLGAGIVPSREQHCDQVRFEGSSTDLDLLQALTARAETVPSGEALALLLEGLDLVYGVPFNSPQCVQWAIDTQLQRRAAEVVEDAALRAVELALDADDIAAARRAVAQALLAQPGNELLYRARMRIEHHAGNVAGVRSVYAELVSVLEDLSGDSQASADPSPETKRLFDRLAKGAGHR